MKNDLQTFIKNMEYLSVDELKNLLMNDEYISSLEKIHLNILLGVLEKKSCLTISDLETFISCDMSEENKNKILSEYLLMNQYFFITNEKAKDPEYQNIFGKLDSYHELVNSCNERYNQLNNRQKKLFRLANKYGI